MNRTLYAFHLSGAGAPDHVQLLIESYGLDAAKVLASAFAKSIGAADASEPRLAVPAFSAPSEIADALLAWRKEPRPAAGDRLAQLLEEILFGFLTPGNCADDGAADIRILQTLQKRLWNDRERAALARGARALQRELDHDSALEGF